MNARLVRETVTPGTKRTRVFDLGDGAHGVDVERLEDTPAGKRWVVRATREFKPGWVNGHWTDPGRRVAVVTSWTGTDRVRFQTVERHTKTQIILDNGERFQKRQNSYGTHQMVGRTDYGPYARIVSPTAPIVERIVRDQRIRLLVDRIRERATTGATTGQAQEIEAAAHQLAGLLKAAGR